MFASLGKRFSRRRILVGLVILLAASLLSDAAAVRAEEVDALGMERESCRQLRWDGKYRESFDCLQVIWQELREQLGRAGKIDVLSQMAELYLVSGSDKDAQACYEAILTVDPHWLPEDFDRLPKSYRQPILDAYKARGYLTRSPALHNVALLDMEVVDLQQEGGDLSRIAVALPTYISAYLQEALAELQPSGEMRIVSHRDRSLILSEVAQSQGLLTADVVSSSSMNRGQLVQAGKLLAIQAFLDGSIIRDPDGKVNVAWRMISVETGEITCSFTGRGDGEDLFPVLQKTLGKWVSCVLDGAELKEDAGAAELGPMAQGVLALEHYHEALLLAESERFGDALVVAQQALELRPTSTDLQRLVENLQSQQEIAGLALNADVELPASNLD